MTEKGPAWHEVQGQSGINQVSSTPPQRRRRSRKKKSKIKKYLEWFIWGAVIILFLGTLIMLLSQVKTDKRTKGSTGNFQLGTVVA